MNNQETRKVETANTFRGFIAELPGVRVDCFDEDARPENTWMDDIEINILTHAHSDHMKGLDSKQLFPKKIYCTEVTRLYIESLEYGKYKHIVPFLEVVDYECPTVISYKSSTLTLTFISTNHCAGSSMVLIETNDTSVLLTGDMRCEKWWVESLPQNELLYPYTSGFKTLDNIYLDTTYAYREEPYIIFPPNIDGINLLNHLIAKYPLDDDDIRFYFADNILGFEDVWVKVFNRFGLKFHSSDNVKSRKNALIHKSFPYNKTFQKDIFSNDDKCKFHICGKRPRMCLGDLPEFRVRIKAVVDVSGNQYANLNMSIPVDDVEAQNLEKVTTLPSGHQIYKRIDINNQEILYLLPKGSNEYLSSEVYYFFSRHSSHQEVANFLSKFPRIKEITPIVESGLSWLEGFQVERHFKEFLIPKKNGEKYNFDCFTEKKYGLPPCLGELKPDYDKFNGISNVDSYLLQSSRILDQKQFSFKGQDDARDPFVEKSVARQKEEEMKKIKHTIKRGKKLQGLNQFVVQAKVTENENYFAELYIDEDTRNGNVRCQDTQSQEDSQDFDLWYRFNGRSHTPEIKVSSSQCSHTPLKSSIMNGEVEPIYVDSSPLKAQHASTLHKIKTPTKLHQFPNESNKSLQLLSEVLESSETRKRPRAVGYIMDLMRSPMKGKESGNLNERTILKISKRFKTDLMACFNLNNTESNIILRDKDLEDDLVYPSDYE